MESQGKPGLKYSQFKRRLAESGFSDAQSGPLKLRLQLLEAFMEQEPKPGAPAKPKKTNVWQFEKGSLTIVDLSCPFVNANDACALFSICLSLFMEGRSTGGRIVALDEAHKVNVSLPIYTYKLTPLKFLTESSEALKFTEQLTSIIAQQRHLATRVVIATQEPTLSPRLLDLCNITIVHRFNSPAWYHTLRKHLAGTSLGEKNNESGLEIFRDIVSLRTGEALVFCPKAMLDTVTINADQLLTATTSIRELQSAYFKMQVRKRVTADGGKSIMAVDGPQSQAIVEKPEKPKSTCNFSGFAAPPTANSFPKGGLATSLVPLPAPTIPQQSLPNIPSETTRPIAETTRLFGFSNIGPTKSFVAPPFPESWQPQKKSKSSKPVIETAKPATEKSVLPNFPGTPVIFSAPPPMPKVVPSPIPTYFPTYEKPQHKTEAPKPKVEAPESKSKVDNWIRDVPKPETSGTTTPRVIAQISTKRIAAKQVKNPVERTESSDDSLESESEGEGESDVSDTPTSDEKALSNKVEVGTQQAIETMSRQFARLDTNTQHPSPFKFDKSINGPPIFPASGPLKKGKKPMGTTPFQARKERDPSLPSTTNIYESITASDSWYRRLSFEVCKYHPYTYILEEPS